MNYLFLLPPARKPITPKGVIWRMVILLMLAILLPIFQLNQVMR